MSVISTLSSARGNSSNFDNIVFNLLVIESGLSVAQTSLTSSDPLSRAGGTKWWDRLQELQALRKELSVSCAGNFHATVTDMMCGALTDCMSH